MNDRSAPQRRMYRLSPLDRTGVFLGLELEQLVVAGVGALAGSTAMVALSVPGGIALAVAIGAVAVARIRGRPLLHLLPRLVRHARRRGRARTTTRPVPLTASTRRRRTKQEFGIWAQELLDIDPADLDVDLHGRLAVVKDRRNGALSVTMRVTGRQFGLADTDEQDAQVMAWGDVLHGFVSERPTIEVVRWSEWVAPSGIAEHLAWLDENLADDPIPDVLDAYRRLLAHAGPMSTRHEVLLSISTHPDLVPRRRDEDHDRTVTATPLHEARLLVRRLADARLDATVLDATELTRAVRIRLDPTIRTRLDRLHSTLGAELAMAHTPMATTETLTHYRADASFHRSFSVEAWPRTDVPSDWLRPLLLHSAAVRTVSVFLRPVARSRSQRHITAEAVKIEADVAHRHQHGHRISAHHHRAEQAIIEAEEELVAGYVEYRYGAAVTVTAPSLDELDRACADIVQVAAGCGIELEALYGQHEEAVAATLPTTAGMR